MNYLGAYALSFLLLLAPFQETRRRAIYPAAGGGGAPVIVTGQTKSAFSNSTTTVNASFTNNVGAGHMILVWVGCSAGVTINTPTMSGETFTKVTGSSISPGGGNGQVALYATNSAVGGQKQVTATTTAGADIHLHIVEVSGQAASPQDATGSVESTTMSVATSGATTFATDLVIAFFFDNNLNRTITAGGSYVQVQQTNNTTGGDVGFSESLATSSTGVQTATASGNSGDVVDQGIIAIKGT